MCTHANRAALERRLLAGEPSSQVAVDAGFSVTAINRHKRNHMRPGLRAELRVRAVPSHVSDFADQLAELAEDADAARAFAVASNNPNLLLQAVSSKRDTLVTLMRQCGVDATETVDSLREARTAVHALAVVLPRHPDALGEVLDVLRRENQPELARALEQAVGEALRLPSTQAIRPKELP